MSSNGDVSSLTIDTSITSSDLMTEFTASISEVLDLWYHKMEELKRDKETERTKAHWTIKLIQSFFNKRGNMGI